jgi:hypothetical protein
MELVVLFVFVPLIILVIIGVILALRRHFK